MGYKYREQLEDASMSHADWLGSPGWLVCTPPKSIQVKEHRGHSWRLFALALSGATPRHVQRQNVAAAKDICFDHDPRAALICMHMDSCSKVHLDTDKDAQAAARFDKALQGWRKVLAKDCRRLISSP